MTSDPFELGRVVDTNRLLELSGLARDIQGSRGIRELCDRLAQEAGIALQDLVTADPANADGIRKMQDTVKRLIDLRHHVASILNEGEAAERVLIGEIPEE